MVAGREVAVNRTGSRLGERGLERERRGLLAASELRLELDLARTGSEAASGEGRLEGVDGLEEVERRGAVVHEDDEARLALAGDGRRGGAVEPRAAADGEEEHVDLADRLRLGRAQLGLTEVTEVAEAEAVEREAEDRVGAAYGAGPVVVPGGDRDDLADRTLEPARGRAQRRGEPEAASAPLWSPCSWLMSSSSASTGPTAG
jgi:hypothetical protein